MTHSRLGHLLTLLLLASNPTQAATEKVFRFSEVATLPKVVAERFKGARVVIAEGSEFEQPAFKRKVVEKSAGSHSKGSGFGAQGQTLDFRFEIPTGFFPSREDLRTYVASTAWRSLLDQELRSTWENDALLRLPKDPHFTDDTLSRLVRFGTARLLNRPVVDDSSVALWWKMKFDALGERAPSGAFLKGEKLLFAVHQLGWQEGPNPNLLDFGHSVLALRTVGGDPANDVIFNPGAKDAITGNEIPLPDTPVPTNLNMVRITNFWDWAETQVKLRFMRIHFYAFRLTPTQIAVLEHLAKYGDRLNFGWTDKVFNNCATGAYNLANTLLPFGNRLLKKPIGGVVPNSVFYRMEGRMPSGGETRVSSPDKHDGASPGTNYLEQNFSPREETYTFVEYLRWENARL
jgi:hypothetical protein